MHDRPGSGAKSRKSRHYTFTRRGADESTTLLDRHVEQARALVMGIGWEGILERRARTKGG
jgi:hypothetical protein